MAGFFFFLLTALKGLNMHFGNRSIAVDNEASSIIKLVNVHNYLMCEDFFQYVLP